MATGRQEGENELQEPPAEWFVAFGYKNRGILRVGIRQNFLGLGDEVKTRWIRWCSLMDPHNSEGITPEGQRQLQEDADYIQRTTGSTPAAIEKTIGLLTKKYKGKKEAPFRVELY